MAQFTLFDEFLFYLGDGTIDLDGDTFKWALTNTSPTAADDNDFGDITEIASGSGYTAGGDAATSVTWLETGAGTGVFQFTTADQTWTASGGSIGPFRWVILYDDTPTSPVADPLVGYLDYGLAITITDGNSFTVNVGASGIFQMSEA